MIIQIDDKHYLIWRPKGQPIKDDAENRPEKFIELYSQYQTDDRYKSDCEACDGRGFFVYKKKPFETGDCEHCIEGQIEYKIVKPELKQVGQLVKEGLTRNDILKSFRQDLLPNKYLLISELSEAK